MMLTWKVVVQDLDWCNLVLGVLGCIVNLVAGQETVDMADNCYYVGYHS